MKKICLVIILILISTGIVLSGCTKKDMLKYYNDDENYTQKTGEIKEFGYYTENDMYLFVLDTDAETFPGLTNGRRIIPDNYSIISDNGFLEEVTVGDIITYTTAVMMYGDEYPLPIVELWANDKCYLDFETGKENWLDYIENEI